jgi:nicotinamide-nucleotide amidase
VRLENHVVTRQVAIADEGKKIQSAAAEALSRADLVITTGGLGPTSDDITRELIAELLGKKTGRKSGSFGAHRKIFRQARAPASPQKPRWKHLFPKARWFF